MKALTIARRAQPHLERARRTHNDMSHGAPIATTIFPTELGWMAIAGREGVLVSIDFGYPSEERAAGVLASRISQTFRRPPELHATGWLRDVATLLEQYASGQAVDLDEIVVDIEHLTPFGRRVVAACRNIPRGEVRTYGGLAAECGSPGAARAVGSVMAKNRYPLVVPCHRVVGAAGGLGGYSAPDGLRMKRRLLAMESAASGTR
jgi:methylated-DNA-[protein]-cysteine S-methyltransferase